MSGRRLFVGIGSPHGDDQVGWLVARRVAQLANQWIDVRFARTPIEVLDMLDAGDVTRLDLCDAVHCETAPGNLSHWKWPDERIARERFAGSHDLSLPAVLELAEALGRLPAEVCIWGISIAPLRPFEELTPEVASAVPRVAERLCGLDRNA
jgi:hydrogenase maturation protease